MKIQELAIVFIIIILPISIVVSAFAQLQIQTINTQSIYDAKLTAATYDAIRAFQINTEYDTGVDITNSKIEDLQASVKTFRNSVKSAFELTGYTEEDMNNYIPALVYTLYDGFYIYSPYKNINYQYEEKKDDEGNVVKDADGNIQYDESKPAEGNGENIYGIKPYISYSCRYKRSGIDVVITYSLDNYITVQGTVNGEYVNRSGYLIDNISDPEGPEENYTIEYNGIEIKDERLTEYLSVDECAYVKLNGTKYYRLESTEQIVYFANDGLLREQCSLAKNKKEYDQWARLIDNNKMAKEYYKEAKEFTDWFKSKGLNEIKYSDAYGETIDDEGNIVLGKIWSENSQKVFEFNTTLDYNKNIENELSNFNQHRLAVIRHNIENNLSIAISNYNEYSGATNLFQMPKLQEDEWDYITHNISLISFLQGLPIGGKMYNGYTIVTNTESKEVVLEQNINILGTDGAYHKIGDQRFEDGSVGVAAIYGGKNSAGRLNLDFNRKKIVDYNEEVNYYYYPLKKFDASYNSVVMQNKVTTYDDIYRYINEQPNDELKEAFYTALGRERYGVYKMLTFVNINDITKNIPLLTVIYVANVANAENVTNMPAYQVKLYGETIQISTQKPIRNGYDFKGWSTNPNASNGEKAFEGGSDYKTDKSIILYAVWKKSEYDIVYKANGGDESSLPTPNPDKKIHGTDYKISKTEPTRTGHVFLGWLGSDSKTYKSGEPSRDTYVSDLPLTLTAQWAKAEYEVTFNANGGENGPGNITKTYGEDIKIPTKNPTRYGYDFLGWSTDPNATEADPKYAPGKTYNTDSEVDLYAVWKKKTFKITYKLNGGTGNKNPTTYEYGDTITLKNVSRSTCKFEGWYLNGKKITKISDAYGDLTITAKFSHSSSCYKSVKKSHTIKQLSISEKNRPSEQLFRFTVTYGYYCNGTHTTGTWVYTRSYLSGSADMGPIETESKSGQTDGTYTHTHTELSCGY